MQKQMSALCGGFNRSTQHSISFFLLGFESRGLAHTAGDPKVPGFSAAVKTPKKHRRVVIHSVFPLRDRECCVDRLNRQPIADILTYWTPTMGDTHVAKSTKQAYAVRQLKGRSHGPALGDADRSPGRGCGHLHCRSTHLGSRRQWRWGSNQPARTFHCDAGGRETQRCISEV